MPQDAGTGAQGRLNGYENADRIGEQLGATRISRRTNEFQWDDRTVLIKTGSNGTVVTRASMGRVDAIIYGVEGAAGWNLWEIDPETFEELSVASRSRRHTEDHRRVSYPQIRENGRRIT